MFKLIALAVPMAALAFAASGGAAGPQHIGPFTFHETFVDTETCSFPIAGDYVFTNDITEFDNPDGTVAHLHLHQTAVGTLAGNGATLSESDRYTIFVDFTDGRPTQAKHVGAIFELTGPHGQVFHVAGQEVFSVVNGFDRDLLVSHGVDRDFDPVTFCAAFA